MKIVTSAYINIETYNKLKAYCYRNDITKSEAICSILEKYLAKEENKSEDVEA